MDKSTESRLTLISSKILKKGRLLYSKYLCLCGNHRYYPEYMVNKGDIKSCGCLKKERISKLKYKDGLKASNLKLYQVWASMRKRCRNKKDNDFLNYGGRGIIVCDEWNNSFKSFYEWSMNNGYTEGKGLSIDRRDNNGNYCSENCRWTDCKTQNYNSRHAIGFEKANKIKSEIGNGTMKEVAKNNNISLSTLKRIKYGKTYN